ncbi:MAG: hypothetical protein MOIL_00458 [Candidatus Methanolliviera sp. GoM_oil]|nr:MAG: hypothetical protein MOIL_00458 [Candidatus Methanolliviera sp. GoM_oil]
MNEDELERYREELKRERVFVGRLLNSVPTPLSIMTSMER